ncbi:threonine/serine exporter family protein [Cellulomonas oligotrophica]|uniref:Uncharacterized membrane protein YjjP (DUF1212 family)/uncharacterized membrane protein YjjB (DUF3815 family) n=1 Tax=Cellulomonas oligotrophica TaxID=931536 RepID=A0A7Y9FJ79_9CELL|nr:threonine/serine exporter family protein [Cellulomonas oligotrophica]NYD87892.1 uncharacterized membrane protein YjjP (DUF1212 family)/uncharacterized membrane protein YjjB (DUF3815 family) [Cellulomonas oligotrophica]GIG32901.1 hypothetical protein Col01nite_20600 [Cellulomonas oligotrophica]
MTAAAPADDLAPADALAPDGTAPAAPGAATATATPAPDTTTVPTAVPTTAPAAPPTDDATPGPDPAATTTPVPTSPATTAPAVPSAPVTPPGQSPSATTTTPAVEVPAFTSPPAVTASGLPAGALVVAALVLLAVTVLVVALWRSTRRTGAEPAGPHAATPGDDGGPATLVLPAPERAGSEDPDAPPPAVDVVAADPHPAARQAETVRFLVALGQALVDSSAPIVQVNRTLERVAAVNDLPDTQVVTFPTALLVSVAGEGGVHTAVSGAGARTLRLDQVQDVLDLAAGAVRGDVRPRDGLGALATTLAAPPPSTPLVRLVGYLAIAAGLSMVLGGGWADVLVATVLGGAVAAVVLLTGRVPGAYQGLLVAACAFLVSVPVLLLARTGLPVGLLAPLVAPLVTFLPGAQLTTGVIDLATRQMIAGSARLAAGVMQLVLLALGITAAAGLVGVPATEVGTASAHPLGWAGPWVGVLVYAVGVVLHNDARRTSLPWIAVVLLTAYAGQVVGGLLLGAVVSAFVGALAMTPVAMLAASRTRGPAFLVAFLPGFWVLVPGALGLVGVTSALGQGTEQAVTTIVTTGTTMVAISLGVLAGLALGAGLQRRLAPDAPAIL